MLRAFFSSVILFACKTNLKRSSRPPLSRWYSNDKVWNCFRIVVNVATWGRNRSSYRFGGRLKALCAFIAYNLLWMTFPDVCSVFNLVLNFLMSFPAFFSTRAKHSRSSTRAKDALALVSAWFLASSNSLFNNSICLLQDSQWFPAFTSNLFRIRSCNLRIGSTLRTGLPNRTGSMLKVFIFMVLNSRVFNCRIITVFQYSIMTYHCFKLLFQVCHSLLTVESIE